MDFGNTPHSSPGHCECGRRVLGRDGALRTVGYLRLRDAQRKHQAKKITNKKIKVPALHKRMLVPTFITSRIYKWQQSVGASHLLFLAGNSILF